MEKLNKFTADVLGMDQSIKVPKMDVRGYAKYVLKNGTAEEKREILGSLKSQLSLANGKISLEKI